MSQIFESNKDKWLLTLAMDSDKFVDALAEQDFMQHVDFNFPVVGMAEKRLFYIEDVSVYDLATVILPKSYLSHYSAVSLWGLTEQIPITINIAQEQSNSPEKSKPAYLEQKNIDEAFKKPQRQSKAFVTFKDYKRTFFFLSCIRTSSQVKETCPIS